MILKKSKRNILRILKFIITNDIYSHFYIALFTFLGARVGVTHIERVCPIRTFLLDAQTHLLFLYPHFPLEMPKKQLCQ